MNRLARFIDSEFTRNSWFFAQTESGMMAAIDFIDYVLKDKSLMNLNENEQKYINSVRECYLKMQNLSSEMKATIEQYRQAYYDAFDGEED